MKKYQPVSGLQVLKPRRKKTNPHCQQWTLDSSNGTIKCSKWNVKVGVTKSKNNEFNNKENKNSFLLNKNFLFEWLDTYSEYNAIMIDISLYFHSHLVREDA